jgi:hypothetical protein
MNISAPTGLMVIDRVTKCISALLLWTYAIKMLKFFEVTQFALIFEKGMT